MPDTPGFPGLRSPMKEGAAFAHSDNLGFRTPLNIAGHRMVTDEPVSVGGTDAGPSPYGLVSAALASCTAMTIHSYAKLKGLPVTDIRVLVQHNKVHEVDTELCANDKSAKIDQLERTIWIDGDLTAQVRERLMQIADRCPVHRTFHGSVRIVTSEG